MSSIKFKGKFFKTSKIGFGKVVSGIVIDLMTQAAAESLAANYDRIPVYTGESRGGLRAMAEALGVGLSISPINPKPRRNRHGAWKSPSSATSLYIEPHRFKVYSINMNFVNDADGFNILDTNAGPANLTHPTPWGFTESFRRGIKTRLARMIRNYPLPIEGWTFRQEFHE